MERFNFEDYGELF